jgi:CelD/BcsL family acetyltransferase involved in cellulose biosynthesis
VYTINPLEDQRWAEYLQRHDQASVFHTTGWLEALRRTYGYSPLVLSTSSPGRDLENGLVFCQVHSRLTGHRLVSLPFSDHCEPLIQTDAERQELSDYLVRQRKKQNWTYIEIRPAVTAWDGQASFQKDQQFYLHTLDLLGDRLFQKLHKSSTQRKIHRAEREGLRYEEGRSDALIQTFYRLLLMTRRRHGLPPPPPDWFHNLRDCLGHQLLIRVASKNDAPIASILTIQYKNSLTYKYGCSDASYHHLGGMHLLLWRAIQDAIREGLVALDLGRSDADNVGLVTFKNRWGATCRPLTYLRYPSTRRRATSEVLRAPIVRWLLGRTPPQVLGRAGQILYRHMG